MKTYFSLLMVLVASIPAYTQNISKTKNIKTMETQNIISTVSAIFNGSDERNWSKVENSFAEQVVLDYTSMVGGEPSKMSPTEITKAWKTLLPGFQSTHHQIGNFTVNIDGNKAMVHNRGLALHYLPNQTGNNIWVVVGTYDFSLTKSSSGSWKVATMKFNLQKQEGNVELPKLAQQNVKEGATFKMSSVSESNKAVIEKFFTSLETLDIPTFLSTWAENGKQLMPLSPENFPHELIGKDAIYNQYKGLPENYTSMQFPRRYFPTDDPNMVIVQYNGIIPLKEGGEYNNNYVGIFNIKDGKLLQFVEYFDPFILQEAFGKKLESNFNVKSTEIANKKIEFKSEGLVLKGLLHLPLISMNTKSSKQLSLPVMDHR
jgi:ketosteroid isomerase-like protein